MKLSSFAWSRQSLSIRMMIGVGIVMMVVGLLLVAMVVRGDIRMEREQFSRRSTEQLEFIRVSITEMAVVGDYATIRQMLRTRVADSSLDRITWIDNTGHSISETMRELSAEAPLWFQNLVGINPIMESSAIEVGGTIYGSITINANPTHVINRIYSRLIIGLEATVLALVLLFSLIAIITTSALRPLRSLESAARKIGAGDYSVRIEPSGSSDVRGPIEAFNTMAAQVEELLAQQRISAGRMDDIREEQTKIIARELHDSLGGNLTMLKLGLSTLSEEPNADHACKEKIQSLIKLSDSTIHLVRELTSALHPPMLDALGMMPTIKWYAVEFSRMTGIVSHVDLCPEVRSSKERNAALFRVVQEALTNVARHAEASRVSIQACEEDDKLVIEISDNGKGLPEGMLRKKANDSGSFGLIGMRERAQYMRGDLDISSVPGRGTTITVSVPLTSKGP
ncbi:MAG: HAMP domain-containing protein [Hyphomicrobiales bacterium]|nr:HAMP domain-containing protein [Hyphomicrobiales bacterium]